MKLSIEAMMRGQAARLRAVQRYSTCDVHYPENVAEHSFHVAFYALMVGTWYLDNATKDRISNVYYDGDLSLEKLLSRAILHDLEEARTGDFPRSFKHSSQQLMHQLDQMASDALVSILGELCPDAFSANSTVGANLLSHWEMAKDETLEGSIILFCDYLAVLSYVMREIDSGNYSIVRHVAEMDKYAEEFKNQRFDFIRPLVSESWELHQAVLKIGPSQT
jgi:5'-deoxynucleotidase YfbR-like HD superfamily hydrolase